VSGSSWSAGSKAQDRVVCCVHLCAWLAHARLPLMPASRRAATQPGLINNSFIESQAIAYRKRERSGFFLSWLSFLLVDAYKQLLVCLLDSSALNNGCESNPSTYVIKVENPI